MVRFWDKKRADDRDNARGLVPRNWCPVTIQAGTKTILTLSLLLWCAAAAMSLRWQYAAPDQDVVFNLRSSTNLALPLTDWPVVAVIPGSNRSWTLPVLPGPRFYTLTASNTVTGRESDFSPR
jgi:hypothetical protein